MQKHDLPRMWDVGAAANYLQVNSQTIRNLIGAGELHGFLIGNKYLMTTEELQSCRHERASAPLQGESPMESYWGIEERARGERLPRRGD